MTNGQRFRGAFITVTSLFFMWGFITVLVDALIPRLKDVFELTYLQAGLVQFAWFTAYGIISIPGGRLIKRLGYKNGILIGLSLAAIGCLIFYPAASTRLFALFLLALFVVASGITILQVAANPYISVLGPEEGASSRLNLAQAFNSLGTTIAPIISATYLLSDTVKSGAEQAAMAPDYLEAYRSAEAGAVQVPFVLLALAFLLLAGIIWRIALPRILEGQGSSERSLSDVFSNGRLRAGALGIFVYVGAEVALGSYMVNYGLNLNVHELMQSSPLLERMAGLAAAIKGQSVAEMVPRASGGPVDVLLGRRHGRPVHWGGLNAENPPRPHAGPLCHTGHGHGDQQRLHHRFGRLAPFAGGGAVQLHHVPHHLYAGHRAVGRRQASRQWYPLHGHRGRSRHSSSFRCPGRRLRIRIGLASSRGVLCLHRWFRVQVGPHGHGLSAPDFGRIPVNNGV